LHPRECDIFPMEPGEGFNDNLPPSHDREFPLLSIIKTVHFELPRNDIGAVQSMQSSAMALTDKCNI